MNLPAEFETKIKTLLGEEFPQFLVCYGMERMQGIRINRAKISPEEFQKISSFDLRPIPWVDNGFFYRQEDEVTRHPHYYGGLYYVQEPSAMVPASRLPVSPGERVLDLCAAPGGKATELGARLGGRGLLVANDVSASRAGALVKNLELAGIPNILVTAETPERLGEKFGAYFDKILVDAPCSGEGMFRKDPALVKSWEKRGPGYYAPLQEEILAQAAGMLRPGGMVLYSTCTFSVMENERVIARTLKRCPELELVRPRWYEGFTPGYAGIGEEALKPEEYPEFDPAQCIRIWPHKMEGEGHFTALLRKRLPGEGPGAWSEQGMGEAKAGHGSRIEEQSEAGHLRRENMRICPEAFALPEKTLVKLPEEAAGFLSKIRFPFPAAGAVVQIKDNLLLLPQGVDTKGLRCLRTGLLLGTVKKNRFEPSQALALALRGDSWDETLNLSGEDYRTVRYLKGETLEIPREELDQVKTGWILVCCDGFPLGWGKWVEGSLRNKYPPAWRRMA